MWGFSGWVRDGRSSTSAHRQHIIGNMTSPSGLPAALGFQLPHLPCAVCSNAKLCNYKRLGVLHSSSPACYMANAGYQYVLGMHFSALEHGEPGLGAGGQKVKGSGWVGRKSESLKPHGRHWLFIFVCLENLGTPFLFCKNPPLCGSHWEKGSVSPLSMSWISGPEH